jgi:hypothetical protein
MIARSVIATVILMLIGGCGRWAVERQEEQAAEIIDARLTVGMTLQAFGEIFPEAQRLDADDGATVFLIAETQTCFWCYSGDGFVRSEDSFARIVRFENEALIGIEPVKSGGKP